MNEYTLVISLVGVFAILTVIFGALWRSAQEDVDELARIRGKQDAHIWEIETALKDRDYRMAEMRRELRRMAAAKATEIYFFEVDQPRVTLVKSDTDSTLGYRTLRVRERGQAIAVPIHEMHWQLHDSELDLPKNRKNLAEFLSGHFTQRILENLEIATAMDDVDTLRDR